MMRYRLVSMLLVLVLLIVPFSGCTDTVPTSADNPIATAEEVRELMASREMVKAEQPPLLCINGVPAVYEESKKAYFFTISDEEAWEKLTPTIEGYTVVYQTDLAQSSKVQLLGSNRGAYLIAYNDTQYIKLTVMFTTLPVMAINTMPLPAEYVYHDADEEVEVVYDENEEPIPYDPYAVPPEDPDRPIGDYETFMELTLLDAHAQEHGYQNGFTTYARAHIRGRSSRNYEKNSYKIELLENKDGVLKERDETLLGMRNDGDWNLNGMYAEPTKVRDKVASDLWLAITADREREGYSTGYRCEYVEVIINGLYHGLYLLTERIDHKQLGLADGDYLYFSEGDVGKHYREFTMLEPDDNDTTVAGYSLKYPKELSDEINEWAQFGELTKLIDVTASEKFVKEAPSMIDLDSLADYEIFIQAAAARDNLIQNTYYAARLQEDGSYLYEFLPWDMDQTFGNRWHGDEPLLTGEDYHGMQEYNMRFWVSDKVKLRNAGGYNDIVKARYAQLRETVLSDEAMIAMVEEANAAIMDSGAYTRNKTRWSYGAYSSITKPMTDFIKNRMVYVDSLYK